jgi:hypothetical protein
MTLQQKFEEYKTFIEEIPNDFSGDELEDFIDYPYSVNKELIKYIYKMILFGLIYDKKYYNKINKIKHKILEFLA